MFDDKEKQQGKKDGQDIEGKAGTDAEQDFVLVGDPKDEAEKAGTEDGEDRSKTQGSVAGSGEAQGAKTPGSARGAQPTHARQGNTGNRDAAQGQAASTQQGTQPGHTEGQPGQAAGYSGAAQGQATRAAQDPQGQSGFAHEGGQASQQGQGAQQQKYSYVPQDKGTAKGARNARWKRPKRKRPFAKAIGCAVACGVIIAACIIGSFAIGRNVLPTAMATSSTASTNDAKLTTASKSDSGEDGGSDAVDTEETAADGQTYTVAQIAEQCSSSVVALTNKGVSEVMTMFGVYQQESEGSGSGVIVSQTDTELLIATNYHVVDGAETLSVCFNDSEDAVYSAQLKGTDSDNDLAVVALQLSDIDSDVLDSISIATIGDSDSLQVGDGVVAIGNALGLGQSVTSGIVSALDREVTIDDATATLLQTDAAINPGNSGGALFNMRGELIGINSAKYASEEIEGMGFAIPMSTAQPIIEELMTAETKEKLTEGYGCLNITGSDVSSDVAEMYGVPEGVYVSSVVEGAAAANAGIQEGDIITALDGTAVTSLSDLKDQLQYYPAGETVDITIQRNGENGYEEMTLQVTLDDASEQQSSQSGDASGQEGRGGYGYGFDDSQGGYGYGYDDSQDGFFFR